MNFNFLALGICLQVDRSVFAYHRSIFTFFFFYASFEVLMRTRKKITENQYSPEGSISLLLFMQCMSPPFAFCVVFSSTISKVYFV